MLIAQPSFSCAPEEGVLKSYLVTEYYWNNIHQLTVCILYTRQPPTQPYFPTRIGVCIAVDEDRLTNDKDNKLDKLKRLNSKIGLTGPIATFASSLQEIAFTHRLRCNSFQEPVDPYYDRKKLSEYPRSKFTENIQLGDLTASEFKRERSHHSIHCFINKKTRSKGDSLIHSSIFHLVHRRNMSTKQKPIGVET